MNYEDLDQDILKLNEGKTVVYININDTLESIPLSNRSKHALYDVNVNSIARLLRISENRLWTIRNLGNKSITEILTWKYILKQSDGKYQVKDTDEYFDLKASSKVVYFYKEDKYVKNIPLEDLNFSNRTINALTTNGYLYLSDLFNKTEEDFKAIGNIGTKSIYEIFEKLESLRYRVVDEKNIDKLSNQDRYIANISYYVPLLHKELVEICLNDERKHTFSRYKDYCISLYNVKAIKEVISNKIIEILYSYETESLDLRYLKQQLPQDFVRYDILTDYLKDLRRKKLITIDDSIIAIKHSTVFEYLDTLDNNRDAQIMKERLSGVTLEEIGQRNGVSRERIRQICNKILSKAPMLEEDVYIPVYDKYNFSLEEFTKTFEVSDYIYYYLIAKSTVKEEDKQDFKTILEDKNISKKFKKNATSFIYKNYMKVNNTYVLKKRPEIISFVIKNYCKQQISFNDFLEIYKRIIGLAPKEDQESLSIDSERGYANRIADNKITLGGPHHSIRYYPFDEYDISTFYSELNIEQYNNLEISTVKFIRDNQSLMKDYDIQDEYELHNFLRKTWGEYGIKDISIDFSRMPHLSIGNASRDRQVTELLFQNAPIKNTDLADLYEEEYGVAKSTILVNFFKCIEKYNEAGIYVIEEKELTKEEESFLSQYLKKDFYKLSTLKDVFIKAVNNADTNKLNTFNLSRFGYKLYSSYLIKDKYDSASSFFNYILTKDEIINELRMDQDLVSLGGYKSTVYNLLEQHILFEFAKGEYININRLEKLGITKELLDNLITEIEATVSTEQFFTMYALSNIPSCTIINSIAGFDNDDLFYDSLLSHTRDRFSSALVSGKHIFRRGKDQFQIEDVIIDILKEEKSMDTYELQKIIKGKYNVDITLDRIKRASAESDLYLAGDYIYINYETYLEEF